MGMLGDQVAFDSTAVRGVLWRSMRLNSEPDRHWRNRRAYDIEQDVRGDTPSGRGGVRKIRTKDFVGQADRC
jgi:hypothetical protein